MTAPLLAPLAPPDAATRALIARIDDEAGALLHSLAAAEALGLPAPPHTVRGVRRWAETLLRRGQP